MNTLPSLFISHGSPMTAIEPREAGAFMKALGPAITARFGRPKAVLAISAHTMARRHVLLAGAHHEAVYDFGGFPDELYTLRYDAPGAPALAPRVAGLLGAAGIPVETLDHSGLDHGIWTPLRYAFPDADVPVLPLSFAPTDSPAHLFALGQALAPLADEGVLIVGSGSLTHNLRMVFGARPDIAAPEIAESAAFREWGAGAQYRARLAGPDGLPPPGAACRADAPDRRALAALLRGRRRRRQQRHAATPAREPDLRLSGDGPVRVRPGCSRPAWPENPGGRPGLSFAISITRCLLRSGSSSASVSCSGP
jgi:4,5-DOPA dioxygenase extradiol